MALVGAADKAPYVGAPAMPIYNLAGVSVDFPFEAYNVQLVYMEKVVLALEHGDNALLESPTGTGKTLSLLCAALGWRAAQVARQRAGDLQPPRGGQPGGDDWASSLARMATSTRTGAASEPTGRLPRIIYASRTHSQLQQVVRELRRTVHRPQICVLGSREQLCCHQDVGKLSGPAQTAACQAVTAANSCIYHRRLQELKRKHGVVPHPQAGLDEATRPVPDIEEFVAEAKRNELCPFYYARELQQTSDVLFMPYNYLLDPKVRRAYMCTSCMRPCMHAPMRICTHAYRHTRMRARIHTHMHTHAHTHIITHIRTASLLDPQLRRALNIDPCHRLYMHACTYTYIPVGAPSPQHRPQLGRAHL